MKKTLYFITNNVGKLREVREFLRGSPFAVRQAKLHVDEVQEVDPEKIIREKALHALARSKKKEFILEDGLLYFDGMGKLPGPLIKWFLQELGNEGLYRLASRMGNCSARAEVTFAYAKGKRITYFHGVTHGRIVKPRGNKDFGWGPIFQPRGSQKTFGEMSWDEKAPWSMRIRALKKLKKFLLKGRSQ